MKELHSSAEQLSREKIKYEVDKEVEEESIVNRLQRQIESLIQNYKVSSKLQASFTSMRTISSVMYLRSLHLANYWQQEKVPCVCGGIAGEQ